MKMNDGLRAVRNPFSNWRSVIAVSRFFLILLDAGMSKSFGVLIGEMVERFGTDYKTMAFICSISPTFMYLLGKKPRLQKIIILLS